MIIMTYFIMKKLIYPLWGLGIGPNPHPKFIGIFFLIIYLNIILYKYLEYINEKKFKCRKAQNKKTENN